MEQLIFFPNSEVPPSKSWSYRLSVGVDSPVKISQSLPLKRLVICLEFDLFLILDQPKVTFVSVSPLVKLNNNFQSNYRYLISKYIKQFDFLFTIIDF